MNKLQPLMLSHIVVIRPDSKTDKFNQYYIGELLRWDHGAAKEACVQWYANKDTTDHTTGPVDYLKAIHPGQVDKRGNIKYKRHKKAKEKPYTNWIDKKTIVYWGTYKEILSTKHLVKLRISARLLNRLVQSVIEA